MRILINRTDAIGDNILTMPMAEAIKKKYPDAEIAILTSFICRDIYKNHPFIDKVYFLNKKESYPRKLRKCFQVFSDFKPTHYFYAGGSQTPNFVAWVKRVPFRGGIRSRLGTFFTLNMGVRQRRSQVSAHEIEYNNELLSAMPDFKNIDFQMLTPKINISFDNKYIKSFHDRLIEKKLDPSRDYIVIHPGMTGHTLNWPSTSYAELIKRLNLKYPDQYNYIISHTPSDNRYLIDIKEAVKDDKKLQESVFFFDGSIEGLEGYMNVLSKARAFLGPSTGTTHLAAILKVPLISIYSPIKAQSSMRWSPVGEGHIDVVNPEVICGEEVKCAKEACPYYPCMDKIEVEDIAYKFQKILE